MERDPAAKTPMDTSMVNQVHKVLDILGRKDGRTFEEKKAEAIQYLQTQTNTALAEMVLDIAAEDEKGARMKSKFWDQGGAIPVTGSIILRDVKESDRPFFVCELCKKVTLNALKGSKTS